MKYPGSAARILLSILADGTNTQIQSKQEKRGIQMKLGVLQIVEMTNNTVGDPTSYTLDEGQVERILELIGVEKTAQAVNA
jgi:hypothetical protein